MKILVTGSNGFLGKNLIKTLEYLPNVEILKFDKSNTLDELNSLTKECDFIFHLAGINRPKSSNEFYKGNTELIEVLCEYLIKNNNKSTLIISSSIQASLENDYGISKKMGEDIARSLQYTNGNKVLIYRFKNLFGKWSIPNYNSVVATWCYNVANDIDIEIDNPNAFLELCYIDDVVSELLNALMSNETVENGFGIVKDTYKISLQELANLIRSFKLSRSNLKIIDTNNELTKKLYATYLSFLNIHDFSYFLKMNIDERGSFTEFIKTVNNGQISINISKPGIIKGNHWHNTKNEKFLVVSGFAIIRFRNIITDEFKEYFVSEEKLEVLDIPVGYTHNIENIGNKDLVTVMWANEVFDLNKPDTFYLEV